MATNVDLSGDTLYVNDIFFGSTTPGTLSGTSLSTRLGASDVVSLTTATSAPTSSQTGTIFTFNRLAGTTVTLPAPVIGTTFTFVVGTVNTSLVNKVITSAGTIFITGSMIVNKAGTVTAYVADGSTDVAVSFNGTTTGGAGIGDTFTLTCLSATEWSCTGTTQASGTLATPFTTS